MAQDGVTTGAFAGSSLPDEDQAEFIITPRGVRVLVLLVFLNACWQKEDFNYTGGFQLLKQTRRTDDGQELFCMTRAKK